MLFHYVVLRAPPGDPVTAAIASWRPLDAVLRNGYLGVDLFFLISGFLLTLPWFVHARTGLPPPSARRFHARRFWRIAPAYYLQLALLFVVVLPLLSGWTYWRSDLYVYGLNALAHLVFLHNLTPLTSGSMGVNGALWTLALEAQYYLLLPLVAPLFVRRPLAMLAIAFALALLWRIGALHDLDPLVAAQMALGRHWGWSEETVRRLLFLQLPGYFAHFALGIVLGRAWLAWNQRAHSSRAAPALVALGLAATTLLLWTLIARTPPLGEHTWVLHAAALGMALFAAAAGRGAFALRVLGRGPIAFLGRVSYSAYLYHVPLLLLWNKFPGSSLGWSSLPLYLLAVLAISWLSWRFIERPFQYRGQTPQ